MLYGYNYLSKRGGLRMEIGLKDLEKLEYCRACGILTTGGGHEGAFLIKPILDEYERNRANKKVL